MKLWKVLSLKVNSYEISKVLSSSVSRMLTLAWGIDILFEKLTPEIGGGGGGFEKTFCTALCLWGWVFHAKPAMILNIFSDDILMKFHHFFLLKAQYQSLQNSYFCNILPYRSGKSHTKIFSHFFSCEFIIVTGERHMSGFDGKYKVH